jgi:hypothetical protein
MSPCFPTPDLIDRCASDAILGGKDFTIAFVAENNADLIWPQLHCSWPFSFISHVSRVVGRSAKKEMIGINTTAIITGMTYACSFGDCAIDVSKNDPVRAKGDLSSPACANYAVPIGADFCSSPIPASRGIANDLAPEAIHEGYHGIILTSGLDHSQGYTEVA